MENLLNKESVKRAEQVLKNFDQNLKVIVLKNSAKTALDAASSLNCEVGAIVKSLLFRADEFFVMCLISGDKKCSLNKLKKIIKKKDVSMANPDEVKNQTGYTIGGVSPVGHINTFDIFIDNTLKRFSKIYAAAGHPNCVFEINFENLTKITSGKVIDVVE
tara:strand:+ start:2262 stop:2744 length:483 start_codon:yes stop_codon:yes gene_type:complete